MEEIELEESLLLFDACANKPHTNQLTNDLEVNLL